MIERGAIARRKRSNIKIKMTEEEAGKRRKKIGTTRNTKEITKIRAEVGKNIKKRKKIKKEDLIQMKGITRELMIDSITSNI